MKTVSHSKPFDWIKNEQEKRMKEVIFQIINKNIHIHVRNWEEKTQFLEETPDES